MGLPTRLEKLRPDRTGATSILEGFRMGTSKAAPSAHGRVASLSRDRAPDDPELVAAKQELIAAHLADHVAKVLRGWPRLTDDASPPWADVCGDRAPGRPVRYRRESRDSEGSVRAAGSGPGTVSDHLYDDTPESDPEPPPVVLPKQRRLIDGPLRGAFQPIRDHRREQAAAANEPCHCCTLSDASIDYSLSWPDDRSWVVDHFPVSIEMAREMGPGMEAAYSLDPKNMASAHRKCNARRGSWSASPGSPGRAVAIIDGEEVEYDPEIGIASERW